MNSVDGIYKIIGCTSLTEALALFIRNGLSIRPMSAYRGHAYWGQTRLSGWSITSGIASAHHVAKVKAHQSWSRSWLEKFSGNVSYIILFNMTDENLDTSKRADGLYFINVTSIYRLRRTKFRLMMMALSALTRDYFDLPVLAWCRRSKSVLTISMYSWWHAGR